MRAPYGVVPALCTTAAAFLATGSALLAFFINEETQAPSAIQLASLIAMLIALFFIGLVPWIITKPVDCETAVNLQAARKSLAIGITLFFFATLFYLTGTYINTKSGPNRTEAMKHTISLSGNKIGGVRHPLLFSNLL